MNKINIISKTTKIANKIKFESIKYSPNILVTAGVIGVVASTVMACKATTKASNVLYKHNQNIKTIHECVELNNENEETYTQEDKRKDLAITYAQTGVNFVKLYGPSILVGVVSITCILTSNNILRKRNIALAAAYETISKGYKQYRNRLIEKYGDDVDKELKYNIKKETIAETEIDENGKKKKVKKEIETIDPEDFNSNKHSEYARFFDDGCIGWDKNSEYNLLFLKAQQCHANDMLKANGYLFLNEVYGMLGIPKTKAGQIVGWVYDEKNPEIDNFVDFGIYDVHNRQNRDFVNGHEKTILLDFNVDGNIWSLMK